MAPTYNSVEEFTMAIDESIENKKEFNQAKLTNLVR